MCMRSRLEMKQGNGDGSKAVLFVSLNLLAMIEGQGKGRHLEIFHVPRRPMQKLNPHDSLRQPSWEQSKGELKDQECGTSGNLRHHISIVCELLFDSFHFFSHKLLVKRARKEKD